MGSRVRTISIIFRSNLGLFIMQGKQDLAQVGTIVDDQGSLHHDLGAAEGMGYRL